MLVTSLSKHPTQCHPDVHCVSHPSFFHHLCIPGGTMVIFRFPSRWDLVSGEAQNDSDVVTMMGRWHQTGTQPCPYSSATAAELLPCPFFLLSPPYIPRGWSFHCWHPLTASPHRRDSPAASTPFSSLLGTRPVLYPALLLQDLLWLIKLLNIFLLFYFMGEQKRTALNCCY